MRPGDQVPDRAGGDGESIALPIAVLVDDRAGTDERPTRRIRQGEGGRSVTDAPVRADHREERAECGARDQPSVADQPAWPRLRAGEVEYGADRHGVAEILIDRVSVLVELSSPSVTTRADLAFYQPKIRRVCV